jgi:hypothetical protein
MKKRIAILQQIGPFSGGGGLVPLCMAEIYGVAHSASFGKRIRRKKILAFDMKIRAGCGTGRDARLIDLD